MMLGRFAIQTFSTGTTWSGKRICLVEETIYQKSLRSTVEATCAWDCCGSNDSDEERKRIAHTHLNNYKSGGGDAFVGKLAELVSSAENWRDSPAELIPLPPSEARLELEAYLRAVC